TRRCHPILTGPRRVLQQIADRLELPMASDIIDIGDIDPQSLVPGRFSAQSGLASYQAVVAAIDLALNGRVDAIVTGPIQKEAWQLAGIAFPGHTELLAQRTGTKQYAMMLTSQQISCVLATIHVPLADVAALLTTDLVLRAIRLGAEALSRKLGRAARVVVCGLNPHAGENGMFSHGEETNVIVPAIAQAKQLGLQVTGPLPPDTAFTPRQRDRTDVYVCMYHDQGLIPLKALAFDDAVNVTLGLPIVRTSVDHGTALDQAWQGTANHRSMLAAIDAAIDLG
ncbi:MAG: 4-hydroxythreonine-4-phosphate dehydrogenase PdxA, partial [Pirellulales bacterium]|nr:4-hydroxythreonine-4-phosphate dehydrogenase PdxA [Pirellulales bacterium]